MHIIAFGSVAALALTLFLRGAVPVSAGLPVDLSEPTLREVGLTILFAVLVMILAALAMSAGI